ncbi:MAG TPA: carboxypeptidase regulatory-like domain-containing protein [Vicinamibacterales bacterium]|nr:carboxypeptidase regulatory-like domain-containing protein [Vicinamibacterales bacterium]
MSRAARRSSTLFVAAAVALAAVTASAQTTTGRIAGTVSDASGAVLPGVTVTATQAGTGFLRTALTDDRGGFVLVDLPGGSYTVKAELEGFKTAVRSEVMLAADGRIGVDFTLQVGTLSETIEVTSPGESVNTISGELARVVDREQVQNLALNGRNYMQLATLIPGAPLLDDNALNIMTGLGINTSINGSRTNASLLMVDGGFNMDSGSNNSQISNVGIDFIEEVSIKTANFSAEYGRNSGAAINVVTRSGGNAFKGSAFEYYRNDDLDANGFLSNARGVEKSRLRYNDFGWSLGGPIQQNRLFFFAGQEWKRIRRFTTPTLRTLPTRAMRAGDFSALATAIRDPVTGQPFPGNVIPTERITPDGRAIANLYSTMEGLASSYDDRPVSNNSLFQGDNPFDFRQDIVRIDYHASQDQRLTVRVIHDSYDLIDPFGTFITSNLPTSQTNRRRPGRNYQFGHAWTISSNLLNEFKANASWNSQRIPPVGDLWQRDTYTFTFPQLFTGGGRFEDSIPDTTISGYAGFNGVARSLVSPTTDIQVSNHMSWLTGAHTLKFGGLVVRNRKDQNGRSLYAGQVNFNSSGNSRTTGNAFADALLGNFRTYTEAAYDPLGLFRFWQGEAFVSDNWRVSRNLSVEAGLRYTWHQPIYTISNNMANFDPSLYDPSRAVTVNRNGTLVAGSGDRYNGMIRVGSGVPDEELGRVPNGQDPDVLAVPAGAPRGLYEAHHLIGPRVSAAWTPTSDGKTAVRGGVGLFYDRPEGNLLFGGAGNGPVNSPPYILSSQYENGTLSAPGGGSAPAPAPLGTLAAIDPNLKVPRSWNWSVSVQRELPWQLFGEIGYVGSRGQNLLRQPDINQPSFEALSGNAALPSAQRANTNFLRPYKGYSVIQMRISDAKSSYHAMQLFMSRRQGPLRATLSYTLGRAYDSGSGNGDNPEDYQNQSFNWGPSDFDRTHILVGTWTWQLPIFREETMVGRVLGGWELSGIYRHQSGAPLTITGNTSIGARRADLVAGVDPYVPESERFVPGSAGTVQYLNPAAFVPAPEGRRGNTTHGQFRGPGLTVWDLSIRKTFGLTGTVKLQIQGDLFNAFNQTNLRFSGQSLNLSSGGFGTLNQAAPPRNVQLGIRLMF